jgi:3-methyl-2-oxobutanoate hydroxymethyltransferase
VTDDMIGMFDWTPKFVRRYGKVWDLIAQAVEAYAADVRSGAFSGARRNAQLCLGASGHERKYPPA